MEPSRILSRILSINQDPGLEWHPEGRPRITYLAEHDAQSLQMRTTIAPA
jgi:hypothetical protein